MGIKQSLKLLDEALDIIDMFKKTIIESIIEIREDGYNHHAESEKEKTDYKKLEDELSSALKTMSCIPAIERQYEKKIFVDNIEFRLAKIACRRKGKPVYYAWRAYRKYKPYHPQINFNIGKYPYLAKAKIQRWLDKHPIETQYLKQHLLISDY